MQPPTPDTRDLRYDDLDDATADLREARTVGGEFGSRSLDDQLYGDLRPD